jgi:phage baseplate assembly protein W
MNGMNATTGQAMDGTAHLVQSIADILGTPLGTRPMRRDYGSLLFDLMDQPINGATAMLLRAATALALRQWEPRITVSKVTLSGSPAAGSLTIGIEATRTDLAVNERTTLSIPLPATLGGASN